MNQLLNRLPEAQTKLFFGVLILFAAITVYFSPLLAAIEILITALLLVYHLLTRRSREQKVTGFIDTLSRNITQAGKDTMTNSPFPMVIFRPENGEVIWSNDRFLDLCSDRDHIFDTHITTAVPKFSAQWLFDGKTQCPDEYVIQGRRYQVFGQLVSVGSEEHPSYVATTYWLDVTDFSNIRDRYYATRPVVSIITIDNYEELIRNSTDSRRAKVRTGIEREISKWIAPTNGLVCRYDRDRYLFIFEEQHLAAYRQSKFALLEAVQKITGPYGLTATLSIGIGVGSTFEEMFQFATLALEMALSRGGDQVVIKNPETFEFYGGRSKETERRTKVKSRVMASALDKLISASSQVIVMGHKFSDLDSVGAAAGICAISRARNIPAYIVREDTPVPGTIMMKRLAALPEYAGVFLTKSEAEAKLDSRTLVVVVDTNRPDQVVCPNLLNAARRIAVIDHHRRAVDYISNAALNYHEPYASSAAELTAELMQYIIEPTDLLRTEAEALLAGIVLDTKNFTLRTGGRTFEAAAFLRRCGGDTSEVHKLFQNNLTDMVHKFEIIKNATLCHDCVVVAASNLPVNRIIAAQAADELINVQGIKASFVLFPEEDKVVISGRSGSDINVQGILETLGGGGNGAAAGAQLSDTTVEAAYTRLMVAIDDYFSDEPEST